MKLGAGARAGVRVRAGVGVRAGVRARVRAGEGVGLGLGAGVKVRVRALEAAPLLLSHGEGAIVGELLPVELEQDVTAEDQALLRAGRER